jgi:uncharacterized membrane protein
MLRAKRIRTAGILLGIGLGGFVDGIALHQIAQWHNMVSSVVPPHDMAAMKLGMAADGWFHAATWIATFAGVMTLWSALRGPGPLPSTRAFLGDMLVGWGGFNLVEGIIDHHLLELHHVRDLPQHLPAYDWAFLLVGGAGFLLLGLALRDRGREAAGIERRSGYERRAEAMQRQ